MGPIAGHRVFFTAGRGILPGRKKLFHESGTDYNNFCHVCRGRYSGGHDFLKEYGYRLQADELNQQQKKY